ncbi:MAG: 50S ribosomal protein L4 [Patescibacteria group bacterium]|nr:50S ribosomal protein L4 [Patescibacteria group bacterium]
MQATTYNTQGKAAGKVTLPENVFDQPWNANLVHEVVRAMQGNARAGTAHTKVRGEVRGGGKKPWRQKGTGRARAGSRRSPIWRGGGVTFGPRSERDYSRKINRKVRARALAVALSQKLRDDEIIFLDGLLFSAPKTKDAKAVLVNLSGIKGYEMLMKKRRNAALVVLAARNEHIEKSFRNFGHVSVGQAKDLNPVELLSYKYVIVADPEPIVAQLASRVASKGDQKPETKRTKTEKAPAKKSAQRKTTKTAA